LGGTIRVKTAGPEAKRAGPAGDDLANARNDSTQGIAGVADALASGAGGRANATVRIAGATENGRNLATGIATGRAQAAAPVGAALAGAPDQTA